MAIIKCNNQYVTAQGTRPYLTSIAALALTFDNAKLAQLAIKTLAYELKLPEEQFSVSTL